MSTLFAILLALLPPCPTEDSRNCSWRADVSGNGAGYDFVDVQGVMILGPVE